MLTKPAPEAAIAANGNGMDLVRSVLRDCVTCAHPLQSTRLDLANGLAGQILVLAEVYALDRSDWRLLSLLDDCLDALVRRLPEQILHAGLFNGLPGIAWTLQHVGCLLERSDYLEPASYDEIYRYLDQLLRRRDLEFEYDLISGLAGIGMWALVIRDSERRLSLLELVVKRLDECGEKFPAGTAWRTPSHRPNAGRRHISLAGCEYNLGIAHGISGVIGFLAECSARGAATPTTISLLSQSVGWLLAQRLRDSASCFADVAGSTRPSRLAWCYGDPGIAVALCKAAAALRCDRTHEAALHVAEHSAARMTEPAWVRDTGICHGSAGLALVYEWLSYQYPQSMQLARAARFWSDSILSMREQGAGIGGFYTWKGQSNPRAADPFWLTGASGVVLALLPDGHPRNRGWTYPLLLSS
jgi:lantibiotic modifying enzyme